MESSSGSSNVSNENDNYKNSNVEGGEDDDEETDTIFNKMYSSMKSEGGNTLFSWMIWLLIGTVVFAYQNKDDWLIGFYHAVSYGYTLGYKYPVVLDSDCAIFSSFYIISGALALNAMILNFSMALVAADLAWYNHIESTRKLKESKTIYSYIYKWLKKNHDRMIFIYIWIFSLLCGWLYAVFVLEYDIIESLYYSLSSLSTAGIISIPDDALYHHYIFSALFSALGISLIL